MESSDVVLKVIVVGDYGVGKTSLVKRYVDGTYNDNTASTIGVDVLKKTVWYCDQSVCLTFFDTAGQEKYASVTDSYFKGARACIIVYDITRGVTFTSIDKWYNKIRAVVDDVVPILIVGNKSDIEQQRDISQQQGIAAARRYESFFIETSCVNGSNVHEAINIIIEKTMNTHPEPVLQEDRVTLQKRPEEMKKDVCC